MKYGGVFDLDFNSDDDAMILAIEEEARARSGGSNIVGFIRNIEVNTDEEGNNAGVLTTLYTFSLDPNNLRRDGLDFITFEFAGFHAANANAKTLQLQAGGNIFEIFNFD